MTGRQGTSQHPRTNACTDPFVSKPDEHAQQIVLCSQKHDGRDLARSDEAGAHWVRKGVGLVQSGVEHDAEVAEEHAALPDGQARADSRAEEGREPGERGRHTGHVRRDVLTAAFPSGERRALAEDVRLGSKARGLFAHELGMGYVRVGRVCLRTPLLLLLVPGEGRDGEVRRRYCGDDVLLLGGRTALDESRLVEVYRAEEVAVDPFPLVSEAHGSPGQERDNKDSDGAEQDEVDVEKQFRVVDSVCGSGLCRSCRGRAVGRGGEDSGCGKDGHGE